MRERQQLIHIRDTRFIFNTNFAGDPRNDKFGSPARKANLIIPDRDLAMDLMRDGFNVKMTKPKPGEDEDFEPTYYVQVKVNYDSEWPPKVYLVSGDSEPRLLDEDSVGIIDNCYVLNVNAVLNPYTSRVNGNKSLYIRTMYVEQDVEDDPFAHIYRR